MGFFTDLKEDLSQAVNELDPENKDSIEVQEAAEEAVKTEEEKKPAKDKKEEKKEEAAFDKPFSSAKAADEIATITEGMNIVGDITSNGSVDLYGSIQGNIQIQGKLNIMGSIDGDSKASEIYAENAKISGEVNSQGSVKIGQATVVIGNIFATSAVIAGAVKGDIDVKGPVILDSTAIVMGNIKSKSVQINNGAVVEGVCSQCYADVSPTSFFDDFKKNKK